MAFSLSLDQISLLVSLFFAISGWLTLFYQYFTDKPKINCRVFGVMVGNFTFNGTKYTTFLTYIYLTNSRKNEAHVLDCEMEIEINGKYVKLDRAYGTQNVQNYTFLDKAGQAITIPDINRKWVFQKEKPIEFGKPLHGFVLFLGSPELYEKQPTSYRIRILDAFYKKRTFVTRREDLPNLYLLADMAGITLPLQVGIKK